jgi:hypothetical protein
MNRNCRRSFRAMLVVWMAFGGGALFAQGVQTGSVTGTVKSADGQTLPGVTVSFKSPALQGVRTVVSDVNGAYLAKGLAPGTYVVSFDLTGMTTVVRQVSLGVGATATVDASLNLAKVEESVTVTAELAPVLQTSQGVSNFSAHEVDSLATNRELDAVADLAPGTTVNGANGGVTVNGAIPYDNVYLLDGVDVADNVFGSPENDLYIDDALEETQVLTSGVSAEYGRFTGGVINAVTKKGGNDFSGSFRTDLSNPAWVGNTPLENANGTKHESKLSDVFQATLGGPIVKDRLWFFLAGLKESTATPAVFDTTGVPYNTLQDQKRIEAKLTGTINPNHTLSVAYTNRTETQTRPALPPPGGSIETRDLITPSIPGSLLVASYNGVLSPKLFAEVRFSQKKSCLCSFGGTNTNLQAGSPIITAGVTAPPGLNYNAPYFDATDPNDRDNRQIAADLSYFLSTAKAGKHDLKAGFENFRDRTTGGNSQSPTNFVFGADYVTTPSGAPLLDANGDAIPNWVPGQSNYANWLATRAAQLDITTNSFYLNDKWSLNDRWSFNIGGRYEFVKSDATGGIVGINTNTFVPRLAASFNPRGDGRFRLDATYARYSGRYNPGLFGNNTPVGNPSLIYAIYQGPPGQGTNFAPAYNPSNYQIVFASSPTGNVKFLPNLSAPKVSEFTVAAGHELRGIGRFWKGHLRLAEDDGLCPGPDYDPRRQIGRGLGGDRPGPLRQSRVPEYEPPRSALPGTRVRGRVPADEPLELHRELHDPAYE